MQNRTRIPLLLIFVTLWNISSGFAQENQMPASKDKFVKNNSIPLFNGKNLDGWYTFLQNRGRNNDPKKVFTVQNGMIRISGEEWGCITTNKAYENYKLIIEFKWGRETHAPRKKSQGLWYFATLTGR